MYWILGVFLVVWLWCILKTVKQQQMFGPTPLFLPLGIYVYGDGIIIGAWWSIWTLAALFHRSWDWWALGVCVFWLVRSGGEVIYWLLEQFATVHRNKPKDLWGSKWIQGESIWFLYQIVNQCFLVMAILGTVYFLKRI